MHQGAECRIAIRLENKTKRVKRVQQANHDQIKISALIKPDLLCGPMRSTTHIGIKVRIHCGLGDSFSTEKSNIRTGLSFDHGNTC